MALNYRGPLVASFTRAGGEPLTIELETVLDEVMPDLFNLGVPADLPAAQGAVHVRVNLPDGRTFSGLVEYLGRTAVTFRGAP